MKARERKTLTAKVFYRLLQRLADLGQGRGLEDLLAQDRGRLVRTPGLLPCGLGLVHGCLPHAAAGGVSTTVSRPRWLYGNDISLAGGLYFTDPYYKRDYWKRGAKEMPECVYQLSVDQKTLTRVIEDLKQPNGIIGTPDGHTLYVADIGASKTYRYAIQSDGSLKDKKLFCEMGSDGMTIDNQGNIYLTGHGVTVFDPIGKKIEHIEVAESWTANVCFGGPNRQTLFITASKGLYRLRMLVKGVDSQ
jgi:hypothetical protein